MASDPLLQRVKKIRISDTVVDQIISLIDEGKLKIGDQLPGERELVSQLQVGRASVREALRILEAQGLIEVRPGKGTYVTGDVSSPGDENVIQWFRQHSDEILDLLEVREVLDQRAAALAVARASVEQIAEIEKALIEAEACAAQGQLDRLVYLDKQFHRLLAQASGNEVLSQLIIGINEAMGSPRRSLQRLSGRAEKSLDEHRNILNAIKSGDPEVAERAVIDHIGSVRDAIMSLADEKIIEEPNI